MTKPGGFVAATGYERRPTNGAVALVLVTVTLHPGAWWPGAVDALRPVPQGPGA